MKQPGFLVCVLALLAAGTPAVCTRPIAQTTPAEPLSARPPSYRALSAAPGGPGVHGAPGVRDERGAVLAEGALPAHGPARPRLRGPAGALRAYATRIEQRVAAYRRWGLPAPLPVAPAPPAVKPVAGGGAPVGRVPTTDRVIFLTVDDGHEKDPEFIRMVQDLGVPVSAFLTHAAAHDDYGYFDGLRPMTGIHNHTVSHPELPRLPYEAQRREICAQQRNLARAFGRAPRFFRPPYGSYDRDTLRAARSCGARAVVLWSVEAWADRVDFQAPDRRLRPGDIVLTHFRGPGLWNGTMADMTRRIVGLAAAQGFAVARLEDYIGGA